MSQLVLSIYSNYKLPDVKSVPSRSVDHLFLYRTRMFPQKVSENCPLCTLDDNLRIIIENKTTVSEQL